MNDVNLYNLRMTYHSIKNLKELDGKMLYYVVNLMKDILSEYETIQFENEELLKWITK